MERSRCQGGSAKPTRGACRGVHRRTQPDILFEFHLNGHRYTCPRAPRGTGHKEKGPTVGRGGSSWPGANRQPDTHLAAFPTPLATQKSRSGSARAQGCSIFAGSSFFRASCCAPSGGRGTPGTTRPPPPLPSAAPGLGSSQEIASKPQTEASHASPIKSCPQEHLARTRKITSPCFAPARTLSCGRR